MTTDKGRLAQLLLDAHQATGDLKGPQGAYTSQAEYLLAHGVAVSAPQIKRLGELADEAYQMPSDAQPGAWQALVFRLADTAREMVDALCAPQRNG